MWVLVASLVLPMNVLHCMHLQIYKIITSTKAVSSIRDGDLIVVHEASMDMPALVEVSSIT